VEKWKKCNTEKTSLVKMILLHVVFSLKNGTISNAKPTLKAKKNSLWQNSLYSKIV